MLYVPLLTRLLLANRPRLGQAQGDGCQLQLLRTGAAASGLHGDQAMARPNELRPRHCGGQLARPSGGTSFYSNLHAYPSLTLSCSTRLCQSSARALALSRSYGTARFTSATSPTAGEARYADQSVWSEVSVIVRVCSYHMISRSA